ncbi:MAG: hypothetical protein WC946_09435 [Bacteroidales bacterium]
MQYFSPIKEKILYFADTLNISRREFYRKIQVSRGTLEAKNGITEEILTKFITTFPEINLEWLILGKGEMLNEYPSISTPTLTNKQVQHCEKCIEKERIISSQQETIETQKQLIHFLQQKILESKPQEKNRQYLK